MMKRILSLLLAIAMMLALVIPVGAVEADTTVGSSLSVDASTVDILQQRLDTLKADAANEMPATVTYADYDIEELKERLIVVMNKIELADDGLLLQELLEEEEYLESQLALNDVLILTDTDLEMIFGNTQLVAHIDTSTSEPGISPNSSSTAVVIPASTTNNLWTYSGLKTNYQYPCYYVEATPKGNRSTLHYIRDEVSFNKPYVYLANALVDFCVSMTVGAVGTAIGKVKLATAFGVVISSDTSRTEYSYEFEESLTARCAFVYDKSIDEYRCTLISHSDKIVYSHRSFGKGWKSYNDIKPAKGIYFDSPYSQAIARFNSGNYLTQIDRQVSFTSSIESLGEKEELAKFTPIYISAISNVN